jgi:hydrogenase/urease accessory protein HupE
VRSAALLRACGAVVAAVAIVFALAAPAVGHEIRPAYLELREDAKGVVRVLWKVPMRGEYRLAIHPQLPEGHSVTSPLAERVTEDASVQTWSVRLTAPLRGAPIRIRGLEATMTDALVRIEFADGTSWARVLTPSAPAATVPPREGSLAVAAAYLRLGVEHILFGADHLLFVFGLLLIVRSGWTLAKTVTAFTAAHSLTLGAATLGWVGVPQAPVEAAIALSILFLGPEIVRTWRGETSLTIRRPWVVAFLFGLLHGFGFAGAMTETGLPRDAVPEALVSFNVGVEAGQLAFVAVVLAARRVLLPLSSRWPAVVARAPGYVVGILGAYWAIERTARVVGGAD